VVRMTGQGYSILWCVSSSIEKFHPCLLFVYDLLKRMKVVIYVDTLVGVIPVNGCDDFTNGSHELG
jgi:hypothetical protein